MNREKFREMYDLLMEQLDVSRELSDDEILGVIDELILTQARELFLSLKDVYKRQYWVIRRQYEAGWKMEKKGSVPSSVTGLRI